jgi:UrcA family protein
LPDCFKETTVNTRIAFRIVPLAIFVLAASNLSPLSVARASDRDPPSVTVVYSDQDLTTSPGVATLYVRIRNAAQSVCGPLDGALLEEKITWTRCVDESLGNAVAKVGNTRLTAYYLAKARRGHAINTALIPKPETIVN